MNIRVEPGVWIIAVSGGVDSVVLLDLVYKLAQRSPQSYKLTVAHFDHGVRPDSVEDRKLVATLARQYGLPFVYEQVALGPKVSEAKARAARYEFLEKVKVSTNAQGIITAHHEDDALETAIHHILRGTGRRGITALKHTTAIQRPLLHAGKQQIKAYAKRHNLIWREDSTNQDTAYLRNYIRLKLLSQFPPGKRAQLAILIDNMRSVNHELDNYVAGLLHMQPHRDEIDRKWFISLPHTIARELVYAWLRVHDVQNLDRKTVERTIVAMKTSKTGRTFSIDKQWRLAVRPETLALVHHER